MTFLTADDLAKLRKLARAKKLGTLLPYFKIVRAGLKNRGVTLTAKEAREMATMDEAISRPLATFLEEQMDLEEEQQDE